MKHLNYNDFNLYRKIPALFLLFLFVMLSSFSAPLGRIEGTVVDATTSKAIPFATVELLKTPDSTVVNMVHTNDEGRYVFENIAPGKYILRISCMGYQKHLIPDVEITSQNSALKLSSVNLRPGSKQLNEVNIVGYKLTGQIENDKTVFTIKEKSAAIAKSGLDLLRQLPDVYVDYLTNEVTIGGSTKILFQVNGKLTERENLMQLNPTLIDKVELITNPGVKYSADIDAVINILIKEDMKYGLSSRINAEVPTNYNSFFTENNASLDYFSKNIRLFVAGNYAIGRGDVAGYLDRVNMFQSQNQTTLNQTTTGYTMVSFGGFSYGADWFINNNNIINVFSSIRPRYPSRDEKNFDNTFIDNVVTNHTQGLNKSWRNRFLNDYSLFYLHKFDKKLHEISVESYYNINSSHKFFDYFQKDYNPGNPDSDEMAILSSQNVENNKKLFFVKTDYNLPISSKLKLSTGYSWNFNHIENSYLDKQIIASDDVDYKEYRHSAYGNISLDLNKFNLQSGIRYETSEAHIRHGYDTINKYNCLLPYASVVYKSGKHTIRLNYRNFIERPVMEQLSPFNITFDAYTFLLGNSSLDPAYISRFELTHRFQLSGPSYISYQPYVNITNDGIRQITLSASNTLVKSKFENVSNELEYGLILSGSISIAKWLNLTPSLTGFRQEIKTSQEFNIPGQEGISWRFNLKSQIILPKNWIIFLNYRITTPTLIHQGTETKNYGLITVIYKQVNERFNISLTTINPYDNQYIISKNKTNTAYIVQQYHSYVPYHWLANIKIGYTFKKGSKGKKVDREFEIDNDAKENRGIF